MSSVICTLFEGHFHYGVAALVNSHYQHGFKGDFFIGYRGELPFWATAATNNNSLNWPGTKTLIIAEELKLHFLPINTNAHFTNYKTHFILELWEKCINDSLVTGILYFDPDIVNKCSWKYYEQWITFFLKRRADLFEQRRRDLAEPPLSNRRSDKVSQPGF